MTGNKFLMVLAAWTDAGKCGTHGRDQIQPAIPVFPAVPSPIVLLRLGGAVLASAIFGLVSAVTFQPWNFWVAVGLGFLFGTAFMVGTGYRILIAVARWRVEPAPVSWSGATAGTALFTFLLGSVAAIQSLDAGHIWLAFGMGINCAYLPIKTACLKIGCCQAVRPFALKDLRLVEIVLSVAVIGLATALSLAGLVRLGGGVAIGGHLAIRLLSRHLRGRWSWGWPPLSQPGAELAPLAVLVMAALYS